MTEWYYAIEGKRSGPVSQSDTEEMIRKGALNRRALVWSEDFDDWQRITDVNVFAPLFKSKKLPPPLPPVAFLEPRDSNMSASIIATTDSDATKSEEAEEPNQAPKRNTEDGGDDRAMWEARYTFQPDENVPWRRYFARLVDIAFAMPIAIAATVITTFVLNSYFDVEISRPIEFVMIGFFFVTMAFLIATVSWAFGNSPGKALYSLRVVSANSNTPPSFSDILFRELKVYFFGLALGFGPIAIIGQLFAYKALTSDRRVFYDRDPEMGDTCVFFSGCSRGRMALTIIATTVAIIFLVYLTGATSASMNHHGSISILNMAQ